MLKGEAKDYYFDNIVRGYIDVDTHDRQYYTFDEMTNMVKTRFETTEKRQLYMSEWNSLTLTKVIQEQSDKGKSKIQCLELLFSKLRTLQRALGAEYGTDTSVRDKLINACQGIEECNLALFQPALTFEGVCAQLQNAINTVSKSANSTGPSSQYALDGSNNSHSQHWTDRVYGNNRTGSKFQDRSYGQNRGNTDRKYNQYNRGTRRFNYQKKCYICTKPGCWSTKHPLEERKQAYERFRQKAPSTQHYQDTPITITTYYTFLAEFEGVEGFQDDEVDEIDQLMADTTVQDSPEMRGTFENNDLDFDQFTTELGEVHGSDTLAILQDQSTCHALTKIDPTDQKVTEPASAFTFDTRYGATVFQGIMPDSGAAGVSTAGELQFQALQKITSIQLDVSTAGAHTIRFGKGYAVSTGTIQVPTPLGTITFHVIPLNTPFLLCLQDMDNMRVKFDNLKNVIIQENGVTVPIIRKWGHPWMILQPERAIAWHHLTETELRTIHRRFGHPSVNRLAKVLQRAGHEVSTTAIEHLTKYCHQCQMHGKSPGRFKFTLKDDCEFNYSVIIDVLYIDGKPVLQVVDSATAFQAARFLRDMSAKSAWETLRYCWIDVYQGPPEYVVHDAGTNFTSREFKQLANSMAITAKEVPVEAHHGIGKVERYHAPLRRAYAIISNECEGTPKEIVLQMAVKAVNDTAGPNGIVPTLLVFGAYPRINDLDAPSPDIVKRSEAIRKAMKEVRELHSKRQVSDALGMRNGPNTLPTLSLPLDSDVRVWREKDGWNGPFKLVATEGENCVVQLPLGPTKFRSTVVKPYCSEPLEHSDSKGEDSSDSDDDTTDLIAELPPCRSGRTITKSRKVRENEALVSEIFLTAKEQADIDLAVRLRKDGVITTPGAPFEQSRKQEIAGLMARGVFEFKPYDSTYDNTRIFNSRFVDEIKGKATDHLYEKSRLVIQAYNDMGKAELLTQSPTIQRASQRLIVALAPSLINSSGMSLWLRDITQAYVQSTTHLNRLILARIPKEIAHLYPEGTIMKVLKPLYGIPEAGTHWWVTYNKHHKEKLSMESSTYDPCLLISTPSKPFGVVGMQTDDTLILGSTEFSKTEDQELNKAKLLAKPKEALSVTTPLIFNGCVLSLDGTTIRLRQKNQSKKLKLVNVNSPDFKQEYLEQRARGAYIATICQPEASYDLSVAAQQQDPTEEDVKLLNKRLQWQIDNTDRGINYIPLDLATAKLFVFVDGSFANNKDLSSQIGYLIVLANETSGTVESTFKFKGNLIHWSSTKSKRVTRSVLASEIYGMVGGVDMAIAISSTVNMIKRQLTQNSDLQANIQIVICTDSYSLYECLVRLGTTKEKRLMIDIMALRQSYERRELQEIRWISGSDNPADTMTKSTPNKALAKLLDTNEVEVKMEGWVRRE
jgi:hypothetical protein